MKETSVKTWKTTALALWGLAAVALALTLIRATAGKRADGDALPADEAAETLSAVPGGVAGIPWDVLRGEDAVAAAPETPAGGVAEAYRLTGVFLVTRPAAEGDGDTGGRGMEDYRIALLESAGGGGRQLAVGEGDEFEVPGGGSARMVRVERDFAEADGPRGREMLFLAAVPGSGGATGRGSAAGGMVAAVEAEPAAWETNRFGVRMGEARWEIQRAELMRYAQEVLDDPRRVAGMYEGLAPDWDDEHKVAGYRLDTALGEADFYAQVGLLDGDVIRRVNSIPMTSQRRSEFLLGEFIQGRLETIVLDIERAGKPQKLVYVIH